MLSAILWRGALEASRSVEQVVEMHLRRRVVVERIEATGWDAELHGLYDSGE